MSKHRSIGERLRRAKTPEARQETLQAWVKNWEQDQQEIVSQFENGVSQRDWDALASATGQLKAVTQKRMIALRGVIAAILKT